MAGGIQQYLKDTRSELHHVAWPTRTQTVVYTVLVAAISVGIALYLGLFDYLFTSGLTQAVELKSGAAQSAVSVTQNPATTTPEGTPATFGLPTSGQKSQ